MKNKVIYITMILIILLNLTLVYSTTKNKQNVQNYFRIHIVANSDSINDQLEKLYVSKSLNEYISKITNNSSSKVEAKQIITKNITNILNICNNTLKENNSPNSVKAYIGNIKYNEKTKDNITMDKGIYDSLKIVIGNGKGENWWSLIYPQTFTNDETIDDEDIKCEFFLVNFFNKLINNIKEEL